MDSALEFPSLATEFKTALETRFTIAVMTLERLKIGLSKPSGTACNLTIHAVENIKKFCFEFIRKFTDAGPGLVEHFPTLSNTFEHITAGSAGSGINPKASMEIVGDALEGARKTRKKFLKTVLAFEKWLKEFENNRLEFKGTQDEFRIKLEDGKALLGDWQTDLEAMDDDFNTILGLVESGISDAVPGEGVDPLREE